MNLYPAIDIFEGRAVRLTRGDYAQKKVYFEHPEEAALKWVGEGASWLHLVDLEGAKAGKVINMKAIKAIREAVDVKLELGGGIRSKDDIRGLIEAGIDRVILGTKALDSDFLEDALRRYSDQIAVGLDVRDGQVQTQGWLEDGGQTLDDALVFLDELGVKTIIYTDIKKDGMLQGPNFESLQMVLSRSKANVILSGGVASLDDIRRCSLIRERNFDGVIIGKAIYEGKFSVAQALEIVS